MATIEMAEISSYFSLFWIIFSFSFLVALTGAMSPGPLLTYTIIKSVRSCNRGYLMGLWVIIGHALLEVVIICLLLAGFSVFLKNLYVVRGIGIIGGIILVYFGLTIALDVIRGKVSVDFLSDSSQNTASKQKADVCAMENPILGGIMVSMSNPYWWVWWATIGAAFMVRFDITFENWPRLFAFFLGHEAGDLAWYLLVSILSYFGLRRLNKKAYFGVLFVCASFMILFGLYLGASPFFLNDSLGG